MFLEWTAPTTDNMGEPAMFSVFPSMDIKVDNPHLYLQYDPSDYPSPRQGGDEVEDAIIFTELPLMLLEQLKDILDNYDQVCPYDNSTSPDVVYSFTPEMNTFITIDLCNETTNYDSKVYVFENEAGNVATLPNGESACNDDYCNNSYQDYLSFLEGVQVFAGNTYYIVVDGYGGSAGEYEINVYVSDPLTNYNIYRNGDLIAQTNDAVFEENMDGNDGDYTYEVKALMATLE